MDNTHNTATTPPATGTPGAPDDVEAPLLAGAVHRRGGLRSASLAPAASTSDLGGEPVAHPAERRAYLPFAEDAAHPLPVRQHADRRRGAGVSWRCEQDVPRLCAACCAHADLHLCRQLPAAALPAFVLLCVVWPALWRASMRSSAWAIPVGAACGWLRGSMRGAYLGFLPIYLPAAVLTALEPLRPAQQGPRHQRPVGLPARAWSARAVGPWSTSPSGANSTGLLHAYERGDLQVATSRGLTPLAR